jgi:hypothetical protein
MKHGFVSEKSEIRSHTLLAATFAALATLIPVAAHQIGGLDHLPDTPGNLFDSDRITTSRSAYPLGIPDSILGLGSYGLTLALILLARNSAAFRRPLALKLFADGSFATLYGASNQYFRQTVLRVHGNRAVHRGDDLRI